MAAPRAVVTGMIGAYGVGGVVWDYGHYLLGLQELGFEVYYLEDSGQEAYDPATRRYGPDHTHAAAFLGSSLAWLSDDLVDRWHLRAASGERYGLTTDVIDDLVAEAELFLNVSGSALLRRSYLNSRRKVLIDTDPGWNHFRNYPRWDELGAGWQGSAAGWRGHDHFFTYGEAIGSPTCRLPDLGVAWSPTRPVVAPDRWHGHPAEDAAWTTVMTWDNFRETITSGEATYGGKELEFPTIEDLPGQVTAHLEIAVGGRRPPRSRWGRRGWRVVSAPAVSRTPAEYRDYVETSRGEFSVAKNVYVATGSGWFSCRSACYLAAGLPVVVQDTGFSAWLPCGEGLLAFTTADEAAAALTDVEADWPRHAATARELAEATFSAETVLSDLLDRVGL